MEEEAKKALGSKKRKEKDDREKGEEHPRRPRGG